MRPIAVLILVMAASNSVRADDPPVRTVPGPSVGSHEFGGLIGGSRTVHGDAPSTNPGTFGWDYAGHGLFRSRVFLGGNNDRKRPFAPSGGTYNTEGIHIYPFGTRHERD